MQNYDIKRPCFHGSMTHVFWVCFFFFLGWKSSALHVMEIFLICTEKKKTAASPRSQLSVPLERIKRLQGLLDGNGTRTRLQLYINAEMLHLLGDCFLRVFNSRSCCCHAFHPLSPPPHPPPNTTKIGITLPHPEKSSRHVVILSIPAMRPHLSS